MQLQLEAQPEVACPCGAPGCTQVRLPAACCLLLLLAARGRAGPVACWVVLHVGWPAAHSRVRLRVRPHAG